MRDISLVDVFEIGVCLEWLLHADKFCEKTAVKGGDRFLNTLRDSLDSLTNIRLSERWILKDMQRWINKLRQYKKYKKLKRSDAYALQNEVREWFDEVRNKLYERMCLELETVGVLDFKTLLKYPAHVFNENKNWKKLSKIAKKDIRESCKCLVFELPTSSVIMTMRATEDVLRKYFAKKTKKKITGFINWGEIIKKLRNTNAKKELIDDLDYIKRNYRNPTVHPEATYTQKQAEWLLQSGIRAIEQMLDDMK